MAVKKPKPYEIGELDQYLFGQGNHYEIYKKLGAHKAKKGKKEGVYFAVWAPHARSVSVVGDFNEWNMEANPMERAEPLGIYTCFIPDVKEYDLYKFCVETYQGEFVFKADPFGNYAELRPGTASRVADLTKITWTDNVWLENRKTWKHTEQPMSIYEAHIGSWKRHPGREDDGFYNYREFAKECVNYLKDMGYTHVELIGIAEHPFDGSWGYQVIGYFAPTSRYGTPEDFAWMVNYFHRNKIGVILDWVPAHFPRDIHGLADFDGTPTYEYADPKKGEHPDWGTKIFDYGKNEVRNFLISNALFWVEQFHVDGLRVDAVASMLYLDYGKQDGQWVANKYGGNKNLEAIDFFKHLNSVVLGRNPGALMIAEESTAWPKVTGSVEDDGLGFSLKWNMGWMHDFTEYMKLDPYFRKDHHYQMTFAMSYAHSENYILVLSHDEVVHLKCSMLNKMPGLGFDKYANLKVGYAFMMGHAGKKLLFMGQEFAQLREWSEERELDWFLLAEDEHRQVQNWVRDLLHLYKRNKAMYEMDDSWDGFEWINADDASRSIFSFVRHSRGKKKNLLFVCNFTPMARDDYRVGVPRKKQYKLIMNSDDEQYGGKGEERPEIYKAVKKECDGRPFSFAYKLPPYGVAIFEF
ncbi:1,4-alpha-glucan branching protein GlgB [Lachnospiraceae bacterium WCA-9-b2]|uniref:1,4-alpha-glucan branching enzyme GlgB n=1 Tax=Sporofaciens musculi TaxID=2681861 RepID=A0A7X3SHF5_9FIRM|nr:1,4-alpha-glucan branching protein GlgB [Sporofaciens musculi]MXP74292.1 1,4-alpha-glucan branching protein GlgB [Sporofaciens musculi]